MLGGTTMTTSERTMILRGVTVHRFSLTRERVQGMIVHHRFQYPVHRSFRQRCLGHNIVRCITIVARETVGYKTLLPCLPFLHIETRFQ